MAISDRVAQAHVTMPFVAAVVQDCPVVFDRDRTLDKIAALTTKAAKTGTRLVVFPEAFVSSYPKGLDIGPRVGGRTTQGRQHFKRYYDSAVDIPGTQVDRPTEISATTISTWSWVSKNATGFTCKSTPLDRR